MPTRCMPWSLSALFAVGFPITVSLGFIALWLALRSLPGAFEALQDDAWSLMRNLVGG